MFASMHDRIENIGSADNDREDHLGFACPARLDIWLVGNTRVEDVCLVDGINSVDERTIDVCAYPQRRNDVFTIAIGQIAVIRHRWPGDAEVEEARRRATGRTDRTAGEA